MKKFIFHLALGLTAIAFCASNLSAQVVNYVEANDGELSGDNLNPTDLSIFGIGTNTVAGTVVDALGTTPNVDVFTFDVAAGTELNGIFLNSFTSTDNVAFIGLNDTNTFPFDAPALSNSPDQSQFIGGLLFGANVGTNLINDIGNGNIGTGFTGPLGPGEYTVYLQQLGGATVDYEFGFTVAVPEPGSAILLFGGLVGLAIRRRR